MVMLFSLELRSALVNLKLGKLWSILSSLDFEHLLLSKRALVQQG